MAQPYRAHAKDLLEPQRYPNGDPPYDMAGWTLPYSMGVRAVAIREPFTAGLVRVDTVVPPPGRVEGRGDLFVLANRSNGESAAIAALLAAGQSVAPAGDSVLVWGARARGILAKHAARYGFPVRAVPRGPGEGGGGRGGAAARLPNGAVCPESACISRGRRVSTRAGRGGYLNSMASVIRQFATVIYVEATSGRGSM
ncbi:MAG: hypothetical protein ACREL9_02970 [Gemmatimonadales bacterium]